MILKSVTLAVGLFMLSFGSVFGANNIISFDARITVSADATIEVAEAIVHNFGKEEQHGIFHTIPYSYQAGTETYTANITSVVVTDELGNPRQFTESRGRGELTLKIGDPKKMVTGVQTYIISFVVEGPFLYFDDYDEFYWNVIGSWQMGIDRATALVDMPQGVVVLHAACYQGAVGSDTACDSDEQLQNSERAGYMAEANNLAAGEGFTVAVSFPKGTIAVIEKPWHGERDVSPWAVLPFSLPVMIFFWMFYMWSTRGRDPRGKSTIVTEFEPPQKLPPSIAGIVYNERSDPREFSAEIVRLAVEGYIKIHRIEGKVLVLLSTTDYLIEQLITEKSPVDPVAERLLYELFRPVFEDTKDIEGKKVTGTLLSKMKHEFVDEKKEIEELIYDEAVVQGFFLNRPDKVRNKYMGTGVVLAILGIATAIFSNGAIIASLGISLILSGIIVAIFGIWMPVRTREGVRIKEHLEGFKRYLEVAEKDRLAFHNAPERTPELFDKYLPYAMAFGVEDAWSEQFADIYTEQPNWYSGSNDGMFAASVFASELSSFTGDFATAAAPQSSGSGGGGSVGGGFGGGGGGTW